MSETLPTQLQEFLKALASETRQQILLQFISGQELSVGAVAEAVGMGQSTTSEHLSLLKRAGLLKSRRDGKEVYYSPDRSTIFAVLDQLSVFLTRCCPPE